MVAAAGFVYVRVYDALLRCVQNFIGHRRARGDLGLVSLITEGHGYHQTRGWHHATSHLSRQSSFQMARVPEQRVQAARMRERESGLPRTKK